MTGETLVNVCQAVIHGQSRYVRHTNGGKEGRVVRCNEEGLEVEAGNNREFWPFEECEEKYSEFPT